MVKGIIRKKGVNKFMFPLFVVLVIIVPVLLTTHGLIWGSLGTSSSAMVYGVKLSSLLFIFIMMINLGTKPIFFKKNSKNLNFFLLIFLTGLLTPFVIQDKLNFFYYLSDSIGFLILFLTIFYVRFLLEKKIIEVKDLYNVLIWSMFLISLGIIVNYFLSGRGKVSIPPEIHFALAIFFCSYFIGYRFSKLHKLFTLLLILVAVFLSQFRMNMVIAFGSILIGYLWSMKVGSNKEVFKKIIILGFLVFTVFYMFSDILIDRLDSIKLSDDFGSDITTVFEDKSANQRFIESYLVLKEMDDYEFLIKFLGKGFGAQYTNIGNVIPNYPLRQHHVHNTIMTLYIRNGLMGILIFLLPTIYMVKGFFSKKRNFFLITVGMLFAYVALGTDQYIYWGLNFGICIAIFQYELNRVKDIND